MTNRDRPHIWYWNRRWWVDWNDGGSAMQFLDFDTACEDAELWWITEGRPYLRPTLTKEN
jgi:hypothetical protein